MSTRMNTPSLEAGRKTLEVPDDATAANAGNAYDDDVQVYNQACRCLFLQVQVAEAMAQNLYLLVFDAAAGDAIRTGRASLFDAPDVVPGASFTFSEPVTERDPDGFPFDRGVRVIACTTKLYDPANVVVNAIKVTARITWKDC